MLRGVYPDLGSDTEVARHLGALRRHRSDHAGAAVAGRGGEAHLFKHVITAQAAYEATPAVLRESLHERVGPYLEGRDTGAGAQLDLLAYHYGRSANLGKKREYLLRAGDRARTDYANAAAIDYYRQAVSAAGRGRTRTRPAASRCGPGAGRGVGTGRADLLRRAGPGHPAGGSGRGPPGPQGAGRGGPQAGPLRRGHRAARGGAGGLRRPGRSGRGGRGAASGRHAGRPAGRVRPRPGSGTSESLQIRRALGDTDQTAALFSNLAIIAEYEGDLDQARTLNEQALALRLEVGNRWAIGVSQNNLGMIALLQADYADAVARFTEAMRLNREVGDEWMVAIAHNNLGNACAGPG